MNEFKIIDILNLSVDFLSKKKIESPRLSVELIMAHFLKMNRVQLYTSFDKPMNEEELAQIRSAIKRASNQEPIQYIIGKTQFFDFEIEVNQNVLIPRPETEHLCDMIIDIHKDNQNLKILDIGTGSGCIAISLAKKINNCKVYAIDISQSALDLASKNAELNDCNIIFGKIDILKQIPKEKFDIIVSNPPYISVEEYKLLPKNVLEYEPEIALNDKNDGLQFYKRFANIFYNMLNEDGNFYLEFAYNQSEVIKKIFSEKYDFEIKKDLSKIDRFCFGRKKLKNS